MTRSHTTRFVLIALIFIGIQILVGAIGWTALKAINATRSYATGESLYSKGQKSAVLSLFKYAQSGDKQDFDAFLGFIKVPLGDRIARDSLDRADPDFEAAAAGLRQSLTDEDDIPSVMHLFVLLRHWGPFAKAVEDWQQGDRLIADLVSLGERFQSLQKTSAPTELERHQFLTKIDSLNTKLNALEYNFSEHLGDAARTAMRLVSVSLAVCSVVLWIAGLWLAWRTYWHGIERDLQLKESERRFRDFAEVASDWFWQTDVNLRISYFSQSFAHALNEAAEYVLGKTMNELGIEVFGGDVKRYHADLAATRPFRSVGVKFSVGSSLARYWSISGVPVFGDDGNFVGYRGTGRDVTAEFRGKQALEEAKAQSEVASRAKSEFLATMSHELRTPLNAIIGFSEVIKDRLFGGALEKYTDYARDIFTSATHLLGIINDILDMSKIEAGQMQLYEEDVAIPGIINAVLQLLHQKIETAQVQLTIENDQHLPLVRADERKLKQIVMNLLSNAVKFTPTGGRIAVLSSLDSAGDFRIEIRDTGIGMTPDEIPKALAAFGQVDSSLARKHQGTGLGLPLVKALVELHGGRFSLASERGVGTSAVITLPKTRARRLAA